MSNNTMITSFTKFWRSKSWTSDSLITTFYLSSSLLLLNMPTVFNHSSNQLTSIPPLLAKLDFAAQNIAFPKSLNHLLHSPSIVLTWQTSMLLNPLHLSRTWLNSWDMLLNILELHSHLVLRIHKPEEEKPASWGQQSERMEGCPAICTCAPDLILGSFTARFTEIRSV